MVDFMVPRAARIPVTAAEIVIAARQGRNEAAHGPSTARGTLLARESLLR
jgi:hypothetical protein